MLPSYILPLLPYQEGVDAQPEFGRPAERRDKVPRDHAGRRPICPRSSSWFGEGNPFLFDQ